MRKERPMAGDYGNRDDLNFHYKRDERIEKLPDRTREVLYPEHRSFMQRNRALLIILLDIVIFVLITLFMLPFIRPALEGRKELGGYWVEAQLSEDNGQSRVTVKFSEKLNNPSPELVAIHVFSEDGNLLQELSVNIQKDMFDPFFRLYIDGIYERVNVYCEIEEHSVVFELNIGS
jgi:hypothetical protein